MRNAFNIVMRIFSSLLGLLVIAMGGIWILQGLKIAFLKSFMAGDIRWALAGVVMIALGAGQIVWSNTRQTAA
ncbi:MAG: hypothetical protein ACHP84_03910 [Caulobacterales bacterium]